MPRTEREKAACERKRGRETERQRKRAGVNKRKDVYCCMCMFLSGLFVCYLHASFLFAYFVVHPKKIKKCK